MIYSEAEETRLVKWRLVNQSCFVCGGSLEAGFNEQLSVFVTPPFCVKCKDFRGYD